MHFRKINEYDEWAGDPDFWSKIHAMASNSEKLFALTEQMKEAAIEEFTELPPRMNKQYLSYDTWQLIEKRHELRLQGKMEEVKEISKQISKAAKQDRRIRRRMRRIRCSFGRKYLSEVWMPNRVR